MTRYSRAEIEALIEEEGSGYHRVDLPYGLHTRGRDRRPTADLIFPSSLAGKSVLEVGCALGFFCFEAERRGAARVLGTELKPDRLARAVRWKDVLESDVEFSERDVLSDPPDEHFDYVCLLNVLHHLPEPVRALRVLAGLSRDRMIVEFATFSDPKFLRRPYRYLTQALLNRLPLLGASSLARSDQTFVFSPPALERILLDHSRLVTSIEFMPSPLRGRVIAVCHK